MPNIAKKRTPQIIVGILLCVAFVTLMGLYIVRANNPTDSEPPLNAFFATNAYNKSYHVPFTVIDKNGVEYPFSIDFCYEYLIKDESTDKDANAMCQRYFNELEEILWSHQIPYEDFLANDDAILSLISRWGEHLEENAEDNIVFHASMSSYEGEGPISLPGPKFGEVLPDNSMEVLYPGVDTSDWVKYEDELPGER